MDRATRSCPRQVSWPTMSLILSAALCPFAAHGQCIDYGDYLHLTGSVDTPGSARDVAVSGSYAYVGTSAAYGFSGSLQVIDVSDPAFGSCGTPSKQPIGPFT